MTTLNLLPWREMRRKEQDKQLLSVLVFACVLAGLLIFYAHLHVTGLINNQNTRNQFLEKEINKVKKEIKEIKELKKQRAALIARMNIIYQLQGDRSRIVHIFDELVTRLPEGVYFKSLAQKKDLFRIKGVAQSNARVSALMRNLEGSEWLQKPVLKIIKVKTDKKSGEKVSQFDLSVMQKKEKLELGSKKGGKAKKPGKGKKTGKGKKK